MGQIGLFKNYHCQMGISEALKLYETTSKY